MVYLASEHLVPLVYCNVNNNNLAWHWQISLLTFSLGKNTKQIYTPNSLNNTNSLQKIAVYIWFVFVIVMQKYRL